MASRMIPIASIRIDGGAQFRVSFPPDAVDEYAEAYRYGTTFPDIVVFDDGEHLWIGDGHLRRQAALAAGLTEINAEVRDGSRRDAVLHAAGANRAHGLRRTQADKRNAVEAILSDPEWCHESNRWIADICCVSHTFVALVRSQAEADNLADSQENKLVPATKMATLPVCCHDDAEISGQDTTTSEHDDSDFVDLSQAGTVVHTEVIPPSPPKPKVLCERCKRVGAVQNCPQCIDARRAAKAPPSAVVSVGDSFEGGVDPAKDRYGKEVPESLRPVFEEVEEFRSLMHNIAAVGGRVEALCQLEAGKHIDRQEVARLLQQAHAQLRFAMPYTECPKCRRNVRDDCEACRGRGWLHEGMIRPFATNEDNAWLEGDRK